MLYQKLMRLKNKHDAILEISTPKQRIESGTKDSSVGYVNIGGYVSEKASFTPVCLKASCTLIFNIADAKGWNAYVNGQKAKITRANFAFMAVNVPAGTSHVWFIYEPFLRVMAEFLSLISLIIVLLLIMRTSVKK